MKIVVTTHGEFAKGILQSYQMIAGGSEDISAICFQDGESLADFSDRLSGILDSFTEQGEVLVLCDLKGGTPYNESMKYALKHSDRVKVVTGVNLPMLIEMGMGVFRDAGEAGATAVESGRDGIQLEDSDTQEDEADEEALF